MAQPAPKKRPVKAATAVSARCAWAQGDLQMEIYHDTEWGRPEHNSRALFEKLLLDGLQAGLSWRTILHRRAGLRAALHDFDPYAMAQYDSAQVTRLMADARLIRNRLKVAALIANARAFVALQSQGQDFAHLLWEFVGQVPQQHQRPALAPAPTFSPQSVALSKTLRNFDFSFVGPTICYAFMQAVGMVNDHDCSCPQHAALSGSAKP